MLYNCEIFFYQNHLHLQKVWKGHTPKTIIMSFVLLKDKKNMVTELKYISLANFCLKNSAAEFFSSLKQKQLFPLCRNINIFNSLSTFTGGSMSMIGFCGGILERQSKKINAVTQIQKQIMLLTNFSLLFKKPLLWLYFV